MACSQGAKVYSIVWPYAPHRPDLRLNLQPAIFPREILEFAATRVYIVTVLQLVIWAWLILGLGLLSLGNSGQRQQWKQSFHIVKSYTVLADNGIIARLSSVGLLRNGSEHLLAMQCDLQFTSFLDGGFGPVGLALTPNEAAE